ncbi:hypothetical protein RR48_05194 [Papilio machaon]|uniref:FLYWCH-type domain-containing protein n=1 Tax=Papilio machaon TaxID=76193 RepID=A0A0N0PCJ3_PAPMA|nr:hypothetical protein RR48_05194 [Papilio machaon]
MYVSVQFVRNRSGKVLALVQGYTFYLEKQCNYTQLWRCTKGGRCKARFTLPNDQLMFVKSCLNHQHKFQKYIVEDGVYIKQNKTQIMFAKSRYGKDMVLLGDYTYSFVNKCISKSTTNWRCSSHNHKGCLAKVVLDSKKKVIAVKGKHNHKPFDYKIHKDYCQLIPLPSGRKLLKIGCHTYSSNNKDTGGLTTWYCSKRISKKCPASAKLYNGELTVVLKDHTH